MSTLTNLVMPAQSALVVIDPQNDFCHPDGGFARGGLDVSQAQTMLPNLVRLIDGARAASVRVIFIRAEHHPWGDSEAWTGRHDGKERKPIVSCLPGTWGAKYVDAIVPLAGEPVLPKPRYSAFIGTPLDTLLRSANVRTLILTGVASNVCVESTARHGYQLDYHVVLASDCAAAFTAAEHDAAVHNVRRYFGRVATCDELLALWRGVSARI